ncbi:MAG: type II toxin-antitoxin system Phd/YefM family antitoxin [Anaerolineae bacterium]|nr:type II toxin-antitoxin system Phd/YefM family antitoxin [Anaerolineae bacterium]
MASEIVRAVREERAEYVITHRGKPVAMIVPLAGAPETEPATAGGWWARIEEIGRLMEEENPNAGSVLEQLFKDREDS